MTTKLQLGGIEIQRIVDLDEPFMVISDVFPAATAEALAPHRHWLVPRAIYPETDRMVAPMQSYLVRTRHHNILIDTCIGCDKTMPSMPDWHERQDRIWLQRMIAAGVQLGEIDYVFCSHLHVDHCGWNTEFIDGRWRPTFPNAKYIFSKSEYEASEAGASIVFKQSVLPIMEAGQAQLVAMDFALDDEVWLQPTPGHTLGHVAINLKSGDRRATKSGDLIHRPIQCLHPEWAPIFDTDPDLAAATRRAFLEEHCGTDNIILTAHFPQPSMGYIVARDDTFHFEYLD